MTGCTLLTAYVCRSFFLVRGSGFVPLARLLSTVSAITHNLLSRCCRPLFVYRQLKVAVVLPACPGRLPPFLITMTRKIIGCQPSPSSLYSRRCILFVYEAVSLELPSHVPFYDQYNHHHLINSYVHFFDFPWSRKVLDLPVCSVARIAFKKITNVSA